MSLRFHALSIALLLCAAAAGAQPAPDPALGRLEEVSPDRRACGTERPGAADLEMVRRATRQFASERTEAAFGGTIRVAFHVITSNKLGDVSDAQIAEQIAELNRNYSATGYQFELASVDRTANQGWFHMVIGTGGERRAKQALARDPARYLNIYTCGPGARLLGWAYYPWNYPEDHFMHGVVVHYGSLPGGTLVRYNLGRTATHEVGHYLGLLHTFENGCNAPGDLVADTPSEADPASRCPEGRDTCVEPGLDPIHNYMDYTDDACVTQFTAGQDLRMDEIVPAFRPGLFQPIAVATAQPEILTDAVHPADQVRAIEFRGAAPSPFRFETAVRFTLPTNAHVSLKVYNVAGQAVRTLIDAPLPAGAHSAMFAARDLPAGLYFLALHVGETRMTRSVILLR